MPPTEFSPTELLEQWLLRQLDGPPREWLRVQVATLRISTTAADLYLAVSLASRKLGKQDLDLSPEDFAAADAARPGWTPRGWTADQAGRLLFMLVFPADAATFAGHVEQLCRTADVGELIAFYRGLPLYPGQEQYRERAAEGVRSNMKSVFEAVAHANPYPSEQLDETAWNQMVLKALFVGSPLHPIQGLDQRANPTLREMLCNYARERWAAKRPVSPELWRCVGPAADEAAVEDLRRVLTRGDARERQAAVLALRSCPRPEAAQLLEEAPELSAAAARGELRWEDLG